MRRKQPEIQFEEELPKFEVVQSCSVINLRFEDGSIGRQPNVVRKDRGSPIYYPRLDQQRDCSIFEA